jgi:hypothetical protein
MKKTTQQISFAPPESAQPDGPRRKPPPPSPRRAWQMAMHQHVHELAAERKTQAEIISRLHLHRQTVRKYLQMPTFVAHYCSPHPSPVEPYRAYLEGRWHQGEVMITTLWQELQGQGFICWERTRSTTTLLLLCFLMFFFSANSTLSHSSKAGERSHKICQAPGQEVE